MDKTRRTVISGSRLFNTVYLAFLAMQRISRESSGSFQSGSTPGQATIDRHGTEVARFSTVCYAASARPRNPPRKGVTDNLAADCVLNEPRFLRAFQVNWITTGQAPTCAAATESGRVGCQPGLRGARSGSSQGA
jgi:hypothetical protein